MTNTHSYTQRKPLLRFSISKTVVFVIIHKNNVFHEINEPRAVLKVKCFESKKHANQEIILVFCVNICRLKTVNIKDLIRRDCRLFAEEILVATEI